MALKSPVFMRDQLLNYDLDDLDDLDDISAAKVLVQQGVQSRERHVL